jgi:UDP-4-amino-4,6-dideoxy-N-acetyl-beta-L-altrosamine transaminase
VDSADRLAVENVLRSDWLTTGPAIPAFESAIREHCDARFAAAVSNATAGLHLACLALGVGPGDRVWTSPNSFVSSADCALQCGAGVDFVDIDPQTYNLSVAALERKLVDARKGGSLPKVVVVVHFGGQPCDLSGIATLARDYGFAVIEDASHALGATYRGEPVGNCRYSDAAVFCFHATKSIAAGEGGMVVTNRDDIAQRVALCRSHGITRDPDLMERNPETEPWRYEKLQLGYNYRMTDMQAALATSQLMKLGDFVRRRAELAARYDAGLRQLPLQLPYRDATSSSSWHLYPIQVMHGDRSAARRDLYAALAKDGISSQVHYIPIHTQPFYRKLGFRSGQFPIAEHYYDGALSLPLFVDLAENDQDRVMEIVRSVLAER